MDAVHLKDQARHEEATSDGAGDRRNSAAGDSGGQAASGGGGGQKSGSGLNAIQAALWINQPGAKDVLPTITKEERMRQECIHETITTERSYVRDLERTLTIFHRYVH